MLTNGYFTITNQEGEHRTFRIRTQKPEARFAAGKRVVALLAGPDNTSDYQGFAFVADDEDNVRVWLSKRGQGTRSAYDWYAYLLKKACEALVGSEGVEASADFVVGGRNYCVQTARACQMCNRLLTDPQSVSRGYGPECWEKVGK
jgi:hypothetical protein